MSTVLHSEYYWTSLLGRCMDFAWAAHDGQFRRDGTTPYIEHPADVAFRCKELREKCVAWLHDVLEDTQYTLERLRLPDELLEAVQLLTRVKGQRYEGYIQAIKGNALARAVKIADMQSNLADTPSIKQVEKYTKGLTFLLEV